MTRADLLRPLVRPDEQIAREVEEMLGRELLVDPAQVDVRVHDGTVTLMGQVERRSLVPISVRLAGAIEGVVRVRDRLTFELDDTGLQPSSSNRQRI